jgi:hypothetical protein
MLDGHGLFRFREIVQRRRAMTNARAAWDAEQIARAVEFTTSRFLGRGRYDTRRFSTLDAARADACGDRRAMVFAVTPEGFTIHIENGDAIAMEKAMTDVTTKTYSSKSNAVRAARAGLKGKHRDPWPGCTSASMRSAKSGPGTRSTWAPAKWPRAS